MNQKILARDDSGLYYVAKLRKATAAGHVVQVIDPGTQAGTHRTWHASGLVHDRSNNPPSTSSVGVRPQPSGAINEVWVNRELTAGKLTKSYARVTDATTSSDIVIDLVKGPSRQRVQVVYTSAAQATELMAQLRDEHGSNLLMLDRVDDGSSTRVISVIRDLDPAT